jgi:asparagine synthase (glutamine-hydrolysing)
VCGIAGIIDWNAPPDVRALKRMTDVLAHRGPDAGAIADIGVAAFGHRRLAVIDLNERANQPMHDEASGTWIVFNGEIYNHVEIRRELKSRGTKFRTQSDTEVILKAYAEYGVRCLELFNGMFALAIWGEVHKAC